MGGADDYDDDFEVQRAYSASLHTNPVLPLQVWSTIPSRDLHTVNVRKCKVHCDIKWNTVQALRYITLFVQDICTQPFHAHFTLRRSILPYFSCLLFTYPYVSITMSRSHVVSCNSLSIQCFVCFPTNKILWSRNASFTMHHRMLDDTLGELKLPFIVFSANLWSQSHCR